MNGIEISPDGKRLILTDGTINGSVIFKPDSSEYPFDRGLPTWIGHSPNDKSSFKVLMRFYKNGWSKWLTIGFWKSNIWYDYGATSFDDGEIKIDWAVLYSYYSKWQFQVVMKRTNENEPSPSFHKLSFFVSDHRTTDNVNISALVNDKPAEIFIPTEHFWQYSLDPDIGYAICSPTSVCMVLRSYDIEVDPLQFAIDNKDPYWGIYGVWPKAVQHAAEFGLDGAVKRYRTWSDAREVLAAGGRIVMSIGGYNGSPLYEESGHLLMLAGFDENGNPRTHDPARSDGYDYKHDKTDLSESWFNKGGVAYTFFPSDTLNVTSVNDNDIIVKNYQFGVYPNPFNPQTNIRFEAFERSYTKIIVYDITGREVKSIYEGMLEKGIHQFRWNASELSSGMYFIRAVSGNYNKTIKALLLK